MAIREEVTWAIGTSSILPRVWNFDAQSILIESTRGYSSVGRVMVTMGYSGEKLITEYCGTSMPSVMGE